MRSTIAATVALVPPSSWMLQVLDRGCAPSRKFSGWFTSHRERHYDDGDQNSDESA